MLVMKPTLSYSVLLATLASVVVPVLGHTYMTNISIGGQKLEEGKCIVKPWDNKNYPEKDVTADSMRCRAATSAFNEGEFCEVAPGSTMSVHMHESGPTDRAISESHRGPIVAYMSRAEFNGVGNVWFKIYEDGYDASSDTWAVDKFVKDDGKIDLVIPADIAPGQYLLRSEVIALHEANRVYGEDKDAGAEFFPSCCRITVSGAGTASPQGYAIPGIYDKNDPGIFFDLWGDEKNYDIPGPEVYVSGSAPAVAANAAAANIPSVSAPTAAIQTPSSASSSSGKSCTKKSKSKRSKKRGRQAHYHQEM